MERKEMRRLHSEADFAGRARMMMAARVLAAVAWITSSPVSAQDVHVERGATDEKMDYAADRLEAALRARHLKVLNSAAGSDYAIRLILRPDTLSSEGFRVLRKGRSITIEGGDGRGVIYGALSVAEKVSDGVALSRLPNEEQRASLPFRAIKFNLPWDSYRSSSALDLHYDTVRDVEYWRSFLDMMADNRFNALTLWNLHPFPYMIRARNFPEASRFSDEELAEWRRLYSSIFRMAKERGIETYVVNWNILVTPEFARAHGLKGANYYPNYKGEGDTSEIVKRYTRESVTQLLEEYPDLTGLGFTLAEQMGGMTPVERQAWIDDTVVAGIRAAKRPVKMIFRAPLSADLGQGGSTSVETERLTRRAIEGYRDAPSPIWMEIKFNWSHGHSSTELVKTHGGPLNDAYFNPAPTNYKVAWTVRNEDFFALRWGVPEFVREHIRRNGAADYVGGYFIGSENYIPAKDYFTKGNPSVAWRYAFERQWLFYKLWGRLLYDPATPDRIFEADFVRRYGRTARPLLEAYALASSTQLRFATSVDFTWDFTLYGEGMMVFGPRGMQPISVSQLIERRPLIDRQLSVKDYVALQLRGDAAASGKITPASVADDLERDCNKALSLVRGVDTSKNASLRLEVADIQAWSKLGLFFAEKLRGAIALQTFRSTGDEARKQAAVDHLERALRHWDDLIAITEPIYNDMPLAHFNPPDNRRNDNNLFQWKRLRSQIEADVAVARTASFPQAN